MIEKWPEIRALADDVIRQHTDLRWLMESEFTIGFLRTDKAKTKDSGSVSINAECCKCSEKEKAIGPYDFVIIFYMPNIQHFTDKQMHILMYHELLHIGTDGRIRPHDVVVGDFRALTSQYGYDWADPDSEYGSSGAAAAVLEDIPDAEETDAEHDDKYEAGEIEPDEEGMAAAEEVMGSDE